MLEAVRGDGCALQFASDELRADPEERVSLQSRWRVFTVKDGVVVVLFFLGKTMGGDGDVEFFWGWVGGFMQPRCWFSGFY